MVTHGFAYLLFDYVGLRYWDALFTWFPTGLCRQRNTGYSVNWSYGDPISQEKENGATYPFLGTICPFTRNRDPVRI